ncbi:MAG TPA: molecular chaperone TorD family protein [Terriglobia bacterium]|nr:molecular chaperone TorD family protein [Terriglobia bacterium]
MIGIYSLYADVLDYPTPAVFSQLRELSRRTAANHSEAAPPIQRFEEALSCMTLAQLQEIYTSSFDLHPDCTPNLGCHLFGEDVRRNIFMARLKERMDRAQVPTGAELPDHLSLVLRLLDSLRDEDETQALVEDCLVPGVTRILSALQQMTGACPYVPAFQSLLAKLKNAATAASVGADLGPTPREPR